MFTGYPDGSPRTSDYFKHPLHEQDKYSIAFSFIVKEPVNGDDLVFGNDFDYPIRDLLPMGFNMGLHIVKWTLDPSIRGDVYADKPYLYSPALASWNQFCIGDKDPSTDQALVKEQIVEESAQERDGADVRTRLHIPSTAAARRKHFQSQESRQAFEFEPGRLYMADFGNQYLNFSGMYMSALVDVDVIVLILGLSRPVCDFARTGNSGSEPG